MNHNLYYTLDARARYIVVPVTKLSKMFIV